MRTHGWRQIRTSFCVRRTELCSTYNCIVHQPILAFRQLPTTAWGFFPASCQVPININLSEFIFIDRLNSRMSNKFFNTLLAAGCWRNAKKMLSTVVRPCAVGWGSWAAAAASSEGGGGVKNATSTKGISPTRAREPVGDGKLYCIFKSCSDVGEWNGFLPFPSLGNLALMDDEVESIDLGLIANFFEGSNWEIL